MQIPLAFTALAGSTNATHMLPKNSIEYAWRGRMNDLERLQRDKIAIAAFPVVVCFKNEQTFVRGNTVLCSWKHSPLFVEIMSLGWRRQKHFLGQAFVMEQVVSDHLTTI
jgi:hypothetical protein